MTFKGGYKVKCRDCDTIGWKTYNEPFECKECGGDEFDLVHEERQSLSKTPVGG